MTVSFDIEFEDREIIGRIARRVRRIYVKHGIHRPLKDIEMDLVATHANGTPLDLPRLEAADDFNVMHDVGGIYRHLDRETGKLTGYFLPRFTSRQRSIAA